MMRSKRLLNLVVVALVIAIFAIAGATANAQVTTGQISGTIKDPNGAVVSGANVTITNIETNATRQATTSGGGEFAFQLLPPGRYKVEVAAAGFQNTQAEAVVNITQTTSVDLQVGVSGGTDIVNVEPETPVLQDETSQNGRVIESETLRQIPLATRNFQQLLTLSAGAQSSVSNSTDLGRGDSIISVNGQRTTSNSVRINGIDANSAGTNSTPNIAVPATDSLQEFVVQTSLYDASNGRNSGGNVEALTRSGSNNFSGNIYYFLRNRAFNANDPFIKARGIQRPAASRNQFGATFGGRIIRDKAFFFGSYQGTRERNGFSLTNSLTSPAIPAGLRDDNRTAAGLALTFGVPIANINPVAINILNARLPNGQFAIPSTGATGFLPSVSVLNPQSGVSRFRENQFNANGDYNITSNNTLAAKFFFADNPTQQANYNFAGLGNGQSQLVGFGGDLAIKQTLISLTDTAIISSNISNQARFGFSRLLVTSVPTEPFTAASLGITNPLAGLFPGAPTIQVAGADANFFFGSGTLADQSSRINAYTAQDTLSIVAGKHRLRVGGEYRASTVKFYFNAFTRGQLIFTSFNNFLQGSGVSILGSGVFDRSYRVKDVNAFIQDDYRISDRLTLNLGLRYDVYGLPVEENGRLVNFLPNQLRAGTAASPTSPPNGIVQAEGGQLAGVPTVEKTLVPVDKNNFAPRVGFAYRVDEAGKLVVRGGYGIYFDKISTRYANTQLFNYPYLALGVGLIGNTGAPTFRPLSTPFINLPLPNQFPTAATVPSPLSPSAPVVGVPISGVFIDPNLQTPDTQQFNLGIQYEFLKNTVLEVGYVGNKGTHLLQVVTLNQPAYDAATNSFTPPLAGATILSVQKNVSGGLQQVQTTSNSNYNSLQITLTKRFARGLQLLGAFTYGRSFDFYSGGGINELTNIPGDQSNTRANYARSDFNREKRLVVSGVYEFPKTDVDSAFVRGLLNDWQVAGVGVFQSGLPFTIIDNPGNNVINRANYRPGFSGDAALSGDTSSRISRYFDTTAFVQSRPVVGGTGSVGLVTNPNFDRNSPFGNVGRNTLIGPGQINVDLSFIKRIPITERIRGEFRSEFFNIFNRVNYANPVSNIALGNFGQIISASTGPRVIQFGFKLNF